MPYTDQFNDVVNHHVEAYFGLLQAQDEAGGNQYGSYRSTDAAADERGQWAEEMEAQTNDEQYDEVWWRIDARRLSAIALRSGDGWAAEQLYAASLDGIQRPDIYKWELWDNCDEYYTPHASPGSLVHAKRIAGTTDVNTLRELTNAQAWAFLEKNGR